MNWQEIKKKYPKAFEYGLKWWLDNIEHYQCTGIADRFLYDFFDGEGIKVIIVLGYHYGYFHYDIYGRTSFELLASRGGDWHTRTEAEEQAFERAFAILEEKL